MGKGSLFSFFLILSVIRNNDLFYPYYEDFYSMTKVLYSNSQTLINKHFVFTRSKIIEVNLFEVIFGAEYQSSF